MCQGQIGMNGSERHITWAELEISLGQKDHEIPPIMLPSKGPGRGDRKRSFMVQAGGQ